MAPPAARSRCLWADRLEAMFGGRQLRQSEKRGDKVGASRAGKTSKRHIVVDGNGLPLGLHVEAGNVHDLKAAIPALESIAVPRRKGRARSRPAGLPPTRAMTASPFAPICGLEASGTPLPKNRLAFAASKPIGIWPPIGGKLSASSPGSTAFAVSVSASSATASSTLASSPLLPSSSACAHFCNRF